MNKSIIPDRLHYTGIKYPLKTKIRYKTQPINPNPKYMQCQCINVVSESSRGIIFDID